MRVLQVGLALAAVAVGEPQTLPQTTLAVQGLLVKGLPVGLVAMPGLAAVVAVGQMPLVLRQRQVLAVPVV